MSSQTMARFLLSEFVTFLRYVPLAISMIIVLGLMLRQLGEYFGVPNLVDYEDAGRQFAGGFALMQVTLHNLVVGYLLVRARKGDDAGNLATFAVTISLAFVPILLLVYGIRAPFLGAFELFGDSWFCVGMLAALGLLVVAQYLGIYLADRILASDKSTILAQCGDLCRDDDPWNFRGGALFLLVYLVVMTLIVTGFGTMSSWLVMYAVAFVFVVFFFYLGIRGPHAIRSKILVAIGAEKLLNRKLGVRAVLAWLIFLVVGEFILCLYSLIPGIGGTPITTVCTLWIGLLACYLIFRTIAVRAPFALLSVVAVLVTLGGFHKYKYSFHDDLSYDLVDLRSIGKNDRQRQQRYDELDRQIGKLTSDFAATDNRADVARQMESLGQRRDQARRQLLEENRVIAPRANWKDSESDVARASHGLLDFRHVTFAPYDTLPNRNRESRPLVVVAVSGGGLRSAAWTYRVLSMLDSALAKEGVDFASHVRLICGASGGMLGAAYYVTNLEEMEDRTQRLRNGTPHEDGTNAPYYEGLTADFLTPVMNTFIFHDVPFMFSPWRPTTDRGVTLQNAWMRIQGRNNTTPLAMTFAELKTKEQRGEIPSLAFTPMIVEDGRRLIVSNMDFRWVATNGGNRNDGPGPFSIEAVELFRMVPDAAAGVRIATAARMSASFPYVSSPGILPTIPRRRVVDAGYYDNYGVSLAASWLFSGAHQQVMDERKIRRVLLIQIRDGISDPHRKLDFVQQESTNQLTRAGEELTTPLTGFYNGQNSSSSFRNDGLLEVLSHLYNARKDPAEMGTENLQVKAVSESFMTMTLEYSGNASLSWYLTDEEKRSLETASRFENGVLRTEQELNAAESAILSTAGNSLQRKKLDKISSERLSRRVRKMIEWWLESPVTTIPKPPFTVTPDARVDNLVAKNRMDAGYRRFTMTAKIPNDQLARVKSVAFLMNHPSFYRKILQAEQRANGEFQASYVGYGALDNVKIRIQMTDGSEYETAFNQLEKTYHSQGAVE